MTEKALGIVADIGGTNARFAVAVASAAGLRLSRVLKMRTAEYATLEAAFMAYTRGLREPIPTRAVISLACPVAGDSIKLTNCPWVVRPGHIKEVLGLEDLQLVNDFGAIARAVPQLPSSDFVSLSGRPVALPKPGVVSVLGPGTGLGVALLHRSNGRDVVIETEGGHIGFAPADETEITIMRVLRNRYPRISAERLVSGPGLALIYEALAGGESRALVAVDDIALWKAAVAGTDERANAAFERFCMMLGTVAGDIALAHGASAVVLAGGLAPRFCERLKCSGFLERFRAKGRFESLMRSIPVAVCTHPDPGLLGAATIL